MIYFLSPSYSWQYTEVELNNSHSLTAVLFVCVYILEVIMVKQKIQPLFVLDCPSIYGSSLLSISQWKILFSNIYSKSTEDIIKNWYIDAELQPSTFLYSAHIRHYCDPDYWKYLYWWNIRPHPPLRSITDLVYFYYWNLQFINHVII